MTRNFFTVILAIGIIIMFFGCATTERGYPTKIDKIGSTPTGKVYPEEEECKVSSLERKMNQLIELQKQLVLATQGKKPLSKPEEPQVPEPGIFSGAAKEAVPVSAEPVAKAAAAPTEPPTRKEFEGLKGRVAKVEKRSKANSAKINQLHGAVKELAIRTYAFEEKYVPYYIGPFPTKSSKINTDLRENIDLVIAVINETGIKPVKIIGFADVKGDEKDNKELSEERARAVKNYLATKCIGGKCIDTSSIETNGRGEARHLGYYVDNRGAMIVCQKQP